MKRYPFDLHVVLWPADDVPGQWLAHCLELDVVSQGNSLSHALDMLKEAVGQVLVSDLQKKVDPMRRRAPQEDWDRMWGLLKGSNARPLAEVASGHLPFVVIESTVTVSEITPQDLAAMAAGTQAPPALEFNIPVAFAPAA